MPARVKCKKEDINKIEDYVIKRLIDAIEMIESDEDEISVAQVDDELFFKFPVGEICGNVVDYVQTIPYIFRELKEKYPDIEVWGVAYEHETNAPITFGPLFHCSSADIDIRIEYDWQTCIVCGEVVEKSTSHNSNQWDFEEEGNLGSLCSPICMLEYVLEDYCGEFQPNGTFTDEDIEEFHKYENKEKAIKAHLKNKIKTNLSEYAEDFKKYKHVIIKISERDYLTEEERELVKKILEVIND